MNRMIIQRALLLAGFALAMFPAADGRAAQGGAGPVITTVMSGLDNPRGLAFAPNGALYVAEAGRGPSDQSCFAKSDSGSVRLREFRDKRRVLRTNRRCQSLVA